MIGLKRKIVNTEVVAANAYNSATDYRLTLECGHVVKRKRQAGDGNLNWKRLPPPKFCYCTKCAREKK